MLLISAGNEIAGAATVNNEFVFANDDFCCVAMGEIAHPENVKNSYGYFLSNLLKLGFKCLASKSTDNHDIYKNIVNFVQCSPSVKTSKYTVLVAGLFPHDREIYDCKINDLCQQYNIEYYSFDIILEFMIWCKNNKHVNSHGYPDAAAHVFWAQHLFEKIIDNHN